MVFFNRLWVLGIFLASCTQAGTGGSPAVSPTETSASPARTVQTPYSLEIRFGTVEVQLSMAETDVLKTLGQPEKKGQFQDPNLPSDIQLRRWFYPGLTLEIAGQEGKGYVSEIVIESANTPTANGLRVGDSRATALTIYGKPSVSRSLGDNRTQLLFSPNRGGDYIVVDLEDDRVIRIAFNLPT